MCKVLTLTTVEQSMLQSESLLFAASFPAKIIWRHLNWQAIKSLNANIGNHSLQNSNCCNHKLSFTGYNFMKKSFTLFHTQERRIHSNSILYSVGTNTAYLYDKTVMKTFSLK